jgi:hypothetical protein
MTDKNLFGVVVRAFGLWAIILGIYAINGLIRLTGLGHMGYYEWEPAAAFAGLYLAAGLLLLRKSELIVEFAYPEAASKAPTDLD